MRSWSNERANRWISEHPWQIGFNYVTSNAVNDIAMWMDSSFNPRLIENELECANNLGFNSLRVFLSYTVWLNERTAFEKNFETFLQIADRHNFCVMPVLFDDCAFDFGSEPQYGVQPEPVYGVHNSRWVPSPGFQVQDDPDKLISCREYVTSIISNHVSDKRIFAWDLFNEPGNTERGDKCLPLLTAVFEWAHEIAPIQPVTSSLWRYDEGFAKVNATIIENSDIISLHAYTPLERTRELLDKYCMYHKPVIITEWLFRAGGNTYETHLPLFAERRIGIWQWGFITGKTQTNLSWSTMNGGTPNPVPEIWQHDILFPDHTPYDPKEIALLEKIVNTNTSRHVSLDVEIT